MDFYFCAFVLVILAAGILLFCAAFEAGRYFGKKEGMLDLLEKGYEKPNKLSKIRKLKRGARHDH